MGKRRNLKPPPPLRCKRAGDKVIYPNRKQARSAVARMCRRGFEGLHDYKCPYGSHRHVGHDNFNKNGLIHLHNNAIASRQVAAVPVTRPAPQPVIERPVRERPQPPTLVGVVVKRLSRQTGENTCQEDALVTINL